MSDSEEQLRNVPLPQPLPEPLALAKLFWRLGLVSVGFSWLVLTCRLSPSLQALFFAECQTACKISDFEIMQTAYVEQTLKLLLEDAYWLSS